MKNSLKLTWNKLVYLSSCLPLVVKCFNDPGIPVNGTRRNFTSVYLSVVNYECAEGYAAQSRICEDNGTWSGQRPVCKGKSYADKILTL